MESISRARKREKDTRYCSAGGGGGRCKGDGIGKDVVGKVALTGRCGVAHCSETAGLFTSVAGHM